jgi:hypothetical protein
VNDRGTIAGDYFDADGTHGFVLDRGGFTSIDVPGALATFAAGINDRGTIVGTYIDADFGFHGYVFGR